MNAPRWNLPLLVAMAAAAATSALGQTAAPAAGQVDSGSRSAASIPDFSGTWSHPYCCGFEPPASGPGPVANKLRRRQIVDADRPLSAANAPLVSSNLQIVGDYTNPILKPHAAEAMKNRGEIELSGVASPTPGSQCLPEGVPYIFWNPGMQMLQQPDRITILYDQDHEVRHVRMNQVHAAQATPSWYGDSVGHYEGDALVIDTVGIKVGPFSMIDIYGTPHTKALHVVERYRLLDYEATKEALERAGKENLRAAGGFGPVIDPNYRGKGLQLQFTVEDDGVFTMPWSATITYRRGLGDWPENVCAENTLGPGSWVSLVPQAEKPDF
jgi:hypothetical protein